MTAQYWIDKLGLIAHPEGGYFKETYRSEETFSKSGLPTRFGGDRSYCTSIYFLLTSKDVSHFHKIQSDEIWHYHQGGSLTIYILDRGTLSSKRLGPDHDKGDSLQAVIPAGCWFGALVNEGSSYVLSGCTVSPGFDFSDFELANRDALLADYPAQAQIIQRLTK